MKTTLLWPIWVARYAWAVIRHKWFVLVVGLQLGAPLWRLIIHDNSKFRPDELLPYSRWFYGDKANEAQFKAACKAHKERNDHHWEYWYTEFKDWTSRRRISEPVVREMVADWLAACRAYGGYWPKGEKFHSWTWWHDIFRGGNDPLGIGVEGKIHLASLKLVEAIVLEYVRGLKETNA
jgi:hypothetical protein